MAAEASSRRATLSRAFINNKGGDRPHLWLTKDNLDIDFEDLLFSLRRKRSLRAISVYNIFSKFSAKEMRRLYNAIAAKPKLERFSVWASQSIPASVVANVLKRAKNAETLAFHNVTIRNAQDAECLGKALQSHASVKKLSLDRLESSEESLNILFAFLRESGLKSLRVSTGERSNSIAVDANSFADLCASSNLEEIYFWGIEQNDESIAKMSKAMETAGSLGLKRLSLHQCGGLSPFTEKGYSTVLRMLQRNFHLEHIYLDRNVPASIQVQLNFYLYLNKSGIRRQLLENNANLSKGEWLDTLACHSNNMGILHYLLRESGSTLWTHS